MSFCADVKNEICSHKALSRCCRRAECAGLYLGAKKKKSGEITFKTSNEEVARLAEKCFERHFGKCTVIVSPNGSYNLNFDGNGDANAFSDISNVFEKDCCRAAFVRGAFLACGQLTNPGSNYRMDFNLRAAESAQLLREVLTEAGFDPRMSIKSNGYATVYFKNSNAVEDLLTYMGATLSTLDLMEVKVEKDYKNHLNRTVNFETANYIRSYNSGNEQINAINKLKARGVFDTLPPQLIEAAELRINNPDASLSSLAAMSGISKSGLNHRLRQLVESAKKSEE
jgi:DNA-binding transcriptional regulator WhiA